MKILQGLLILFMLIGFLGCGEDEEGEEGSASTTKGWHFQGRDCLACHNLDLQDERHLFIGGTLFKASVVNDQDDLDNSCGGEWVINFLDSGSNIVYSSLSYTDSNSKGDKGKGNLFILARMLDAINGDFTVQITDKLGRELAKSNPLSHQFTYDNYNINESANVDNRRSCNACHITGGVSAPLFVQNNQQLCE